MKFRVEIIEVLSKTLEIEAECLEIAEEMAQDNYNAEADGYVLDASNCGQIDIIVTAKGGA